MDDPEIKDPNIPDSVDSEGFLWALRKLSRSAIWFFLALGTFCLISYHLGTLGIQESPEGTYASIARAMVDNSEWLTPRLNGVAYYQKPPLTYWASAMGMKFLGVGETGARAFLPIVAALTVIGCYQIGLLFFSAKGALCSAFVLMTNAVFLIFFRLISPDPLLALLETWMAYFILANNKNPGSDYAARFWICLSLAVLSGGIAPVVSLFGILPVILYAGNRKNLRKLLLFLPGFGIFLFLGLGWFLISSHYHPGLSDYLLEKIPWERFSAGNSGQAREWYIFFVVLIIGFFPWTPFFIESLWYEIKEARKKPQLHRLVFLSWFFVPLIIYSFSNIGSATCLLPLAIPGSLFIGELLGKKLRFCEEDTFDKQLAPAISLIFFAIIGLFLIFVSLLGHGPDAKIAKLGGFLAIHFMFLAAFGYGFLYLRFGKGVIMVLGMVIPGVLFFSLPVVEGNEKISAGKSLDGYKDFIYKIKSYSRNGEVLCVSDMLNSSSFYFGQSIKTWEINREGRFDPDYAMILDLKGNDTLKELATNRLYLLSRTGGVEKVRTILARDLVSLEKFNDWELSEVGAKLDANSTPVASGWLKLKDAVASGEVKIKDSIASGGAKIKDGVASGEIKIKESVASGGAKIKDGIASGETKIKDSIASGGAKIKDGIASGETKIKDSIASGGAKIKDAVATGEVKIGDSVASGGGKIRDAVASSTKTPAPASGTVLPIATHPIIASAGIIPKEKPVSTGTTPVQKIASSSNTLATTTALVKPLDKPKEKSPENPVVKPKEKPSGKPVTPKTQPKSEKGKASPNGGKKVETRPATATASVTGTGTAVPKKP